MNLLIAEGRESYSRRDCRCGMAMERSATALKPLWRCGSCGRTAR